MNEATPDRVRGLVDAVCAGRVDDVRDRLKAAPALTSATDPNAFGATALIHAVLRDDRAMIDLLIESGADVDQRSAWWAGSFGVLDHDAVAGARGDFVAFNRKRPREAWARIEQMLCTLVLVAAGLLAQAVRAQPPNILFIFSDDHAPHAIGAYGSRINETPNIDRIAREGAIFRESFCTNSICAPSRAVILTGKFSHLNGVPVNGRPFDGAQPTFPKMLRAAGYQTAMIGKWHLRSEPTGFDYWRVLPGQGSYYNPELRTPDGNEQIEGYVTDIVTDLALAWLGERDPDRPFLLMCQHKAPHRPWMPGPDHLEMYDGVTIAEPDTLFDDYAGRTSAAAITEMTIADHFFGQYDLKLDFPVFRQATWELNALGRLTASQRAAWDAAYAPRNAAFLRALASGAMSDRDVIRWKYQRYVKDYLRCIASIDDNIGRMLDALDAAGLAGNTVVIYASDQGFYLGDHGWYDKRWMYEESLRMPFIVRWPGVIRPGTSVDAMIQNIDYAPTFLDMAGLPAPDDMQGASLVPLMRGRVPADWRKSIYYHYTESPSVHRVPHHYGVRDARYKLICYYNIGEWELFDLERDPDELRSVYGEAAYAEVTARLKAALGRLRETYRDSTGVAIGSVGSPGDD